MSGGKSESRYNVSTTQRQKLVGFVKKPSHFFKKPTAAKKSRVIFKTPASAFWRQKLPNESTLKLYILRSSCPEEEPHSPHKLIVY
jgi:hypothetical protein